MTYLRFTTFVFITFLLGQKLSSISSGFFAPLNLVGTFLHEGMHYLAAAVLGGSPYGFSIVPDGDSLGHVYFIKNYYNVATVGLAPFFLIPVTLWGVALAVKHTNPIKIALWLLFATCAWTSCVPSPQDFSIAAKMPTSWPLTIIFGLVFLVSWKLIRRTLRSV